jgi:hypothetical protein
MSYDLDVTLGNCDHRQSFERYIVDTTDFKTLHLAEDPTLNMRAPINGREFVELFIGGKSVPQDHSIYGYTVEKDSNPIATLDNFSKITFNKPVRLLIPLIEVSYFTRQTSCLKCNAYGKLNDLKKASSGSVLKVITESKLAQRCLKFILTSKCLFYPSFTCRLKTYIGKKFGSNITEADITQEIVQALERLKQVQTSQRQIQTLEAGETLKGIASVVVKEDTLDPTLVRVRATVSSFQNGVTPLNFSFRVNN